tara:strand:+ start:737 stop:1219 length:483 start_codon:yes stop_codon:yes gene_type:complete
MKPIFTIILLLIIASCSEEKLDDEIKLNETNLTSNIKKLITHQIKFEEVSITYVEFLEALDDKTKKEFLKDGIETYKTSLPKWRKEASSLLKSLCSEDDIEIMEQNMYRGPGKGNFNVIEGRIKFNCKDQSKNLKYLGFEIDDRIFLSSLKEVPPGVFVR